MAGVRVVAMRSAKHVRRRSSVWAGTVRDLGVPELSRGHRWTAMALLLLQLAWAILVPIKNVVFVHWPAITKASAEATTSHYPGMPNDSLVLTGTQVVDILRTAVQTVLDSSALVNELNSMQAFSVDRLSTGLTHDQREALNRYAMLVHQMSEFPGGLFTPRDDQIQVPDSSADAVRVVRYTCSPDEAKLTGAVCSNAQGEPCKFDVGEVQTYTAVSLDTLRAKTSLENHLSLLMIVEQFHTILMSFFRTQQWSSTVNELTNTAAFDLSNNESLVLLQPSSALGHDPAIVAGNSTVRSCAATELFVGKFYAMAFALDIIQTELLKRSVFTNSSNVYRPSALATRRILALLPKTIMRITTGVRCIERSSTTGNLFDHNLTDTTQSTCYKRLSRTLTGSPVLGSPTAFVQSLFTGDNINSHVTMTSNGTQLSLQHALLGGLASNMDTFKNDRTLMTNRMWKLREMTTSERDAVTLPAMAQAHKYEAWMLAHLARGKPNSVIDIVDNHLEVNIDPSYPFDSPIPLHCSAGMILTLLQVAFLALLQRNPLLFHLGWNTMVGGDQPFNLAVAELGAYQFISENSLGLRSLVTFEGSFQREAMWPMLPILEQHRQELGNDVLAGLVLKQLNASFQQVVVREYQAVMYRTTGRCYINVNRSNILEGDSFDLLYQKQYPTYASVVTDLIQALPTLAADMWSSVGPIEIPKQYITGTNAYPLGVSTSTGPAVPFEQGALKYGIMRLINGLIPSADFMDGVRASENCYKAIDLRYLNATVRCFQEDDTLAEQLTTKTAERLRTLLSGNWSIAVILNVITFSVVILHAMKIIKVFLELRMRDLTLWHAFHVHLQGPNILRPWQLVVMAASTIPLLIACHLPTDPTFVTETPSNTALSQILVALCLSWFIRLGVEIAAFVISIRYPNPVSWIMLSRFRNVLLVPIMFIRIGMHETTYQQSIYKMVGSCAMGVAFGFFGLALACLWPSKTKVGDDDWLTQVLASHRVSRARVGTLAHSPLYGWSLSAFALEGWSLRTLRDKPALVLEDRYVLSVSSEGDEPFVTPMRASQKDLFRHPLVTSRSDGRLMKSKSARTATAGDVDRTISALFIAVSNGGLRASKRWLCLVLIFGQAIWTLVLPIRNVVLLPYPKFQEDGMNLTQMPYVGPFANLTPVEFTGTEIMDILNKTLQITLDNPQAQRILTAAKSFKYDLLTPALSADEHEILTKFITLHVQVSVFPPSLFVVRDEFVYFSTNGALDNVTYSCRPEYHILQGMRCTNEAGEPCRMADWEKNRTNTFVNLTDVYRDGGVTQLNTFALNHLVFAFFDHLNHLYILRDWSAYVAALHAPDPPMNNETVITYDRTYKAVLLPNVTDKRIYSCWTTETLLMENTNFYFIQRMLQTEFLKRPVLASQFKVRNTRPYYPAVDDRVHLYDNIKLYITSGVRLLSNNVTTASFASSLLSKKQVISSATKFTPSRLYGAVIGDPYSMIMYMSWYPGLYSYIQSQILANTTAESEMYLVGSLKSGMNTFRGDNWVMSNRHFPIRERIVEDSPKLLTKHVNEDEQIAAWFGKAQDRDIGLRSLVAKHLDDTPENMECHAALLFILAQHSWLMALTTAPVLTDQVFYSTMFNTRQTAPWYLDAMTKMQVLGQTSLGQMRPIQYVNPSYDMNAAWPMVPLLSIFRDIYNASTTTQMLLAQLNATFTAIVTNKDGKLNLNVRDSCSIGTKAYKIQASDSIQTIYTKLYPAFVQIAADVVDAIPAIHKAMLSEVAPEVFIRRELIAGTQTFPKPLTTWNGPPMQLKHTALSIGLMKLSTKNVPKQDDVRKLLVYEQCYDVLDLRYLNVTTRCMYEDGAFLQVRTSKESTQLRVMMSVLWGLAAVLNIFSAYVAMLVAEKIWQVFRQTRFRDINFFLALDINAQGPSIVSLGEILIMTASCAPMLLGYHLPTNEDFIDAESKPSVVLREVLIALSLTWYIRLGMELASMCIHLKVHNFWSLVLQTRARYLFVLVVFLIRLNLDIGNANYDKGVAVFIVTITLVTLASFLLSVGAKVFDKIPANGGDVFERAMMRMNLNRMHHGTLGQTPSGCVLSGLLLEGWRASHVDIKDKLVLTCDAQRCVLEINETGVEEVLQPPFKALQQSAVIQ